MLDWKKFSFEDLPKVGEQIVVYFKEYNVAYMANYDGRDVHFTTERGIYTLDQSEYKDCMWAYINYPDVD